MSNVHRPPHPVTGAAYRGKEIHDAVNRRLVLEVPEHRNADVVQNGLEVINSLKEEHYDLILMDIQMPTMDGLEATKIIRDPDSNIPYHDIPIIAMTAHAMQEDRKKCLDSGMNGYISKPIDAQILINEIEKQISGGDNMSATTNESKTQIFDRDALFQRLGDDEEFIKEIIEVFTEDFQSQIDQLEQAVKDRDPGQVTQIGHTMKGACKNVGAIALSEIAYEIESIGKSQLLNEINTKLEELKNNFNEFKACFT